MRRLRRTRVRAGTARTTARTTATAAGEGARATRAHEHNYVSYYFVDQVGGRDWRSADGGGVQRVAGAQGVGAHSEPLGADAGGAFRSIAAAGRRREVYFQRRSDAAACL